MHIPPKTRQRPRLLVAAVATASLVTAVAGAGPASAVIDTTATPVQLAQALANNPSVVTGASFATVSAARANAVSDTPLTSFPTHGSTYAVLTTGDAQLADDANTSDSTGADNGGGNFRGDTDFDVTVLKIDVNVPSGANCLVGMDFRFLSDEFPEYVNTQYNDAFVAELDESTWTTSGSTISAPDNFAFDPAGEVISINSAGNTSMSAEEAAGTTYDGATPLLTAATPVTAGAHSLYLSIFDQGDRVYDSAVFVDNLRFGQVANPATQCVPGAKPVDLNPCLEEPPPGPGDIVGTSGDDMLSGTAGPDRIFGLGGNDRIAGLGGDDILYGGPGDDRMAADAGNDALCGGNGRDQLAGGMGDDRLVGGEGDDRLDGGPGLNTNDGGPGSDQCVNPSPGDNCWP